jgi:hypothetical protein
MTSSSSVWGIEGAAAEDVEMGMWLFSGMGIVGSIKYKMAKRGCAKRNK